ncbi:hypothetical protein AB0D04_32145 [Streptomyces sp. NPDC048483]|uniref:hypothetical protein n=1 Tax=Streptomyces sp. NPDC048483 TaxID=3154927 RepID=UPI003448D9EC
MASAKEALVRAGQSLEKATLTCRHSNREWHSDGERQQDVAGGLDDLVRAARGEPGQTPSGTDLVRDA